MMIEPELQNELNQIKLQLNTMNVRLELLERVSELVRDNNVLINDEKVRNAVRTWADANDYDKVLYDKDKDCLYSQYGSDETDTSVAISFNDSNLFKELEHRHLYSIKELCGDES